MGSARVGCMRRGGWGVMTGCPRLGCFEEVGYEVVWGIRVFDWLSASSEVYFDLERKVLIFGPRATG